ncbi:hypothetical protein C1H46_036133 [Malus baccata]|uniref:Uncharacterized protein n=1 Tax=Malus baccata TaxID=106549 RepID=A0A540KVS9_MALBA|nr:hypothetical protein C1H46_036133 [Malus baccata]
MGQRLVKSTGRRQADPPLQRRSSFFIMQAEEQQAFKINVQAKCKNFDFKFKSTQIVPAWKLHRISISLKLRKFFLRVNSESTVHQTKKNPEFVASISRRQHHPHQQKQSLKSKLSIFKKLSIHRSKKPRCPEAESTVNRLKQFAYEYCGELVLDYIRMAWHFARMDGWPKFLI